jgi:hypothetical protein
MSANMTGPHCLSGVTFSSGSFLDDFAAGRNGFVEQGDRQAERELREAEREIPGDI